MITRSHGPSGPRRPSLRLVKPAGSIAGAVHVNLDDTSEGPSAARFQLMQIIVEDRPLKDALGNDVPSLLQVGATIEHWADPELARAWFQHAMDVLNDSARVAHLDSLVERPGAWVHQEQQDYMLEIVRSLANGFNALNIVWHNDPASRATYRKYIAGTPSSVNNNADAAVFGRNNNYRSVTPAEVSALRLPYGTQAGWYEYFHDQPSVIGDGQGMLPAYARRLFLGKYASGRGEGHPNLFVPAVGLTLSVPLEASDRSTITPDRVEVQSAVRNAPFVNFPKQSMCRYPSAFPMPCAPEALLSNMFNASGNPVPSDGTGEDDWRVWGYQSAFDVFGNEPDPHVFLPVYIGAKFYLWYLRELTEQLLSRTPGQIIQDSRAFVAYVNWGQIQQMGGPQQFLSAVLTTPGDVELQQQATRPYVEAAAQLAFQVGGALAAETYGISAVVGGIVGAGLMIGDRLVKNDVHGHGKDDLGRWKPFIERAWLDVSSDPGQARGPGISVPAPPGFTRTEAVPVPPGQQLDQGYLSQISSRFGAQLTPPVPHTNKTDSGVGKTIAWGAGILAAVIVIAKVAGPAMGAAVANPKRSRRRTRRRR